MRDDVVQLTCVLARSPRATYSNTVPAAASDDAAAASEDRRCALPSTAAGRRQRREQHDHDPELDAGHPGHRQHREGRRAYGPPATPRSGRLGGRPTTCAHSPPTGQHLEHRQRHHGRPR